jgi:uncharacterized protein
LIMRAMLSTLVLLTLAYASPASALDVPAFRARVNDYAKILPADRAAALERRLEAYEQQSGHQFALLTVPSLEGEPIESFGIRVYDTWKLGDEKNDDGLVLIVVPNDRKMRVEVGYGLEGVVPDAIGARVIREVLAPAFQREDYAGGIDAAFDALMRAASGQAPPEGAAPAVARPRNEGRRSLALFAQVLLPVLLMLLINFGGGGRGRRRGGGMWIAPMLAGMGGRGGFGGGGFGGGGGGFGGGGGGRSGGGGASGGW